MDDMLASLKDTLIEARNSRKLISFKKDIVRRVEEGYQSKLLQGEPAIPGIIELLESDGKNLCLRMNGNSISTIADLTLSLQSGKIQARAFRLIAEATFTASDDAVSKARTKKELKKALGAVLISVLNLILDPEQCIESRIWASVLVLELIVQCKPNTNILLGTSKGEWVSLQDVVIQDQSRPLKQSAGAILHELQKHGACVEKLGATSLVNPEDDSSKSQWILSLEELIEESRETNSQDFEYGLTLLNWDKCTADVHRPDTGIFALSLTLGSKVFTIADDFAVLVSIGDTLNVLVPRSEHSLTTYVTIPVEDIRSLECQEQLRSDCGRTEHLLIVEPVTPGVLQVNAQDSDIPGITLAFACNNVRDDVRNLLCQKNRRIGQTGGIASPDVLQHDCVPSNKHVDVVSRPEQNFGQTESLSDFQIQASHLALKDTVANETFRSSQGSSCFSFPTSSQDENEKCLYNRSQTINDTDSSNAHLSTIALRLGDMPRTSVLERITKTTGETLRSMTKAGVSFDADFESATASNVVEQKQLSSRKSIHAKVNDQLDFMDKENHPTDKVKSRLSEGSRMSKSKSKSRKEICKAQDGQESKSGETLQVPFQEDQASFWLPPSSCVTLDVSQAGDKNSITNGVYSGTDGDDRKALRKSRSDAASCDILQQAVAPQTPKRKYRRVEASLRKKAVNQAAIKASQKRPKKAPRASPIAIKRRRNPDEKVIDDVTERNGAEPGVPIPAPPCDFTETITETDNTIEDRSGAIDAGLVLEGGDETIQRPIELTPLDERNHASDLAIDGNLLGEPAVEAKESICHPIVVTPVEATEKEIASSKQDSFKAQGPDKNSDRNSMIGEHQQDPFTNLHKVVKVYSRRNQGDQATLGDLSNEKISAERFRKQSLKSRTAVKKGPEPDADAADLPQPPMRYIDVESSAKGAPDDTPCPNGQIRNAVTTKSIDDQSLTVKHSLKNVQRKSPMISFDKSGPKNQGRPPGHSHGRLAEADRLASRAVSPKGNPISEISSMLSDLETFGNDPHDPQLQHQLDIKETNAGEENRARAVSHGSCRSIKTQGGALTDDQLQKAKDRHDGEQPFKDKSKSEQKYLIGTKSLLPAEAPENVPDTHLRDDDNSPLSVGPSAATAGVDHRRTNFDAATRGRSDRLTRATHGVKSTLGGVHESASPKIDQLGDNSNLVPALYGSSFDREVSSSLPPRSRQITSPRNKDEMNTQVSKQPQRIADDDSDTIVPQQVESHAQRESTDSRQGEDRGYEASWRTNSMPKFTPNELARHDRAGVGLIKGRQKASTRQQEMAEIKKSAQTQEHKVRTDKDIFSAVSISLREEQQNHSRKRKRNTGDRDVRHDTIREQSGIQQIQEEHMLDALLRPRKQSRTGQGGIMSRMESMDDTSLDGFFSKLEGSNANDCRLNDQSSNLSRKHLSKPSGFAKGNDRREESFENILLEMQDREKTWMVELKRYRQNKQDLVARLVLSFERQLAARQRFEERKRKELAAEYETSLEKVKTQSRLAMRDMLKNLKARFAQRQARVIAVANEGLAAYQSSDD